MGLTTERSRKAKVRPSLETLLFATPEQKLLRFLLSNPTTTFSSRALSSKLKGVRGLGGAEGIGRILQQLEELELVRFVNNNRAVGVHNESCTSTLLKKFIALCDLEGLQVQLEPLSTKGVLFGSRATGEYRSDSDYDLFVVSDQVKEVERVATSHPLGKRLEVIVWDSSDYLQIEKKNPPLAQSLEQGIVLWGSAW